MSSPTADEVRDSVSGEHTDIFPGPTSRPTSPTRPSPLAARLRSTLSDRSGRRSSTSPLRDEWTFEGKADRRASERKIPPWARRRHPRLGWKTNKAPRKTGRVFVVDYVKAELSKEGMRKVAAREIHHLRTLEKLYSDPDQNDTPVMRLFHVQNADWAVKFLLQRFAIDINDIVGNDFAKYASYSQPETRGGRTLPGGRTWAPQHDPWRGVNKMAFGTDYLKLYPVRNISVEDKKELKHKGNKMMELNDFDESTGGPSYEWNVYPQRLSCYIQKEEELSDPSEGTDVENPYTADRPADSFDNGNVIIIFENCPTGNIEDTLLQARGPYESRWRRLPFYIAADQREVESNEDLALECMKYISQDVWNSLSESWELFLNEADHHVAILEEKIYEQPADESRADEIWLNSSNWLKIERLMYAQLGVARKLNKNLKEYVDDPGENSWLDGQIETFEALLFRVSENLIKPTDSLSDLMYKSVGIRDTRHSLELSYSMWRLSWITFIFLPLNYSTSFFGMNVDTFQDNPPLKWYFISAVPLLVVVFLTYWGFKHLLLQSRQTPYSRGIYERFFHELSEKYPSLWYRNGPRSDPNFRLFWQKLQWQLIRRWNKPSKTIQKSTGRDDDQFDGLGTWQHLKKVVTRRWTAELDEKSPFVIEAESQTPYPFPGPEKYARATTVENHEEVICETDTDDYELRPAIPPSQPQNLLPLPTLQNPVTTRGGGSPRSNRFSMLSTSSRERRESHGSQGSGGVMVEEHKENWLCNE